MENTKDIYACSYKEVMTILAYLEPQELEKIPEEKLEYFFNNMDDTYEYKIDYTESFQEQKMLPATEAILANLFRDYLATPIQKEQILLKEQEDLNKIEKQKNALYNIENTSEHQEEQTIVLEEEYQQLGMIVYNDSFISRITRWIRNKLKFNKKI